MNLLRPAFLETATSAADVQKLMKADLKNSVGKRNVKFVAAKNCVIGGKTIPLFIVTETPALYEAVLKEKYPKAYRAKGTCDVVKNTESGATQVLIKTSAGQMLPDAVVKLMPEAVGRDKSFVASVAAPTDKLGDVPTLKVVAKPNRDGVSEQAKRDYKLQSKRTVMASMTSDGKVGSVYFVDGSRIRTTHDASPSKERHDPTRSVRFNVNEGVAHKEYLAAGRTGMDYDTWLQHRLNGINVNNPPKWATLIDSPSKAHDRAGKGDPTGSETLIEIFKSINGELEGWHPSRGTATKLQTDKQTISVLQAGIKHIDTVYPKPNDWAKATPTVLLARKNRNQEFYKFVESRLPNSELLKLMRKPPK